MGDEVPVRDVLCEAMEYLSKLGSNLRIRSENLKQKRVNKKKLINCHAVQKAANKVLRICDLSKKSLDNVEAGVKNVLSFIATSQSTANERKTSIDENTSKYKYFHHDSSKLRIPKKVPIKHYTSVRVSVEGMPGKMQEKYPVYHDCKLYRLRKKKKKILDTTTEIDNKESVEEDLNSEKPSDSIENIIKIKSKTRLRRIASESEKSDSVDKISENESNTVQNKDTEKNYFAHNLEVDSQQTDNESKKRKHTDMIADDNDAAQLPISKRKCNDSKEADVDVNLLENHNENQDVSVGSNDDGGNEDEVDEVNKEKDPCDLSKEDSINKQDDLSVVENGDFNNKDIEVEKCDEPVTASENRTAMKDVLGNFEKNDTVGEIIAKGKKKTRSRISSDDSSVENITENTVSVDSPGKNSGKENEDESISKTNENSNELVTINDKIDKENTEEVEGEVVVKPLIKCVSISKLLKPDILTKEAIPPNKFSPQKKDKCLQRNTRETKDSTKKICTGKQISSVKDKRDEEYWLEKRAEVKAFKSKPFDVNITRFSLSKNFLQKHSLKRITRGGSVIFEITESGSVKNMAKAYHNEIKSALLNDTSDESSHIQNTRSESPKSRRKRIRESIREKRNANFSSSDTEDDELKKAVSKIKNHSLEGKSSSEDENDLIKKVNAFHKRRLINSSSDEDGNDKIPEKTNSNSFTLEKENLTGEKEEDKVG